jgi:hypothetical protein
MRPFVEFCFLVSPATELAYLRVRIADIEIFVRVAGKFICDFMVVIANWGYIGHRIFHII